MRGLAWASTTLMALSGCGGSVASSPSDRGAGGDATVRDSTASAATIDDTEASAATVDTGVSDGGVGQDAATVFWCAAQGTHVFCEDFTSGVPGQLTAASSPGATVTADATHFTSPPQAMLSATPPLPDDGGQAWARGSHHVSQTGAHFRIRADVRVDSSCATNGDPDRVMILGVDYPTEAYGMTMFVVPTTAIDGGGVLAWGTLEVAYGPDGGATPLATKEDYNYFPTDEWRTFTMWADEPSAGGFSVSGFGFTVSGDIHGGPAGPYHAPTLWAGISVRNQNTRSLGCRVSVDNVLFDVGDAHIP